MNEEAATPEQIIAVLKQWAKARGFLHEPLRDYTTPPQWIVHFMPTHVSIGSFAHNGSDYHGSGGWRVPRAIALAWALLVESEAAPVDVGRCPACVARGGPMAWRYVSPLNERQHVVSTGWIWSGAWLIIEGEDAWPVSRHCHACTGTGRETIPAERLLLNAVSGDAIARDRLLVHVDLLQASGHSLGELLGYVLRHWSRPLRVIDCDAAPDDVDLSLAYTAEAVRWLEWLTAQHELIQNRNASNYTVTVDGYEYHVSAHASTTASEIAAALNKQGGLATFGVSADGSSVVTTMRHNGATVIVASGPLREADVLPLPQLEPRRRQHAEHIGSRLGRRLGVRR